MQIEEFLEESADLLQWLDEADTTLQTKDPSPADEDALEELIDKIKVSDMGGIDTIRVVSLRLGRYRLQWHRAKQFIIYEYHEHPLKDGASKYRGIFPQFLTMCGKADNDSRKCMTTYGVCFQHFYSP